MKVAVIDLGTNTFNLLIVDKNRTEFRIVYHTKIAVMLGSEGILNGFISKPAFVRAYQAIKVFHQIINQQNCNIVKALGTSAIRSAKNAADLIQKVKNDFNITIEPITGNQEATYIYYGAKAALNFTHENYLILDIGGGSNEFIIANNAGLLWKKSFNLGGARMLEKFKPHDPVLPDEIAKMQYYFEQELSALLVQIKKTPVKMLVGCSGAFDCFASMIDYQKQQKKVDLKTKNYEFTLAEFQQMAQSLLLTSRAERMVFPGLDPVRVDTIVVATIFTQLVLKITKITKITQSAYSLKEGVAAII